MGRPIQHQLFPGYRKGQLTLVSLAPRRGRAFICKCDCGTEVVIRADHLRRPNRQYCSNQCKLLSKKRLIDLTGRQFGDWAVIQLASSTDDEPGWLCKCRCGAEKIISGGELNAGRTHSCFKCANAKRRKWLTPEERRDGIREISRRSARKHAARVKAAKIKYETKRAHASPPWLTKEHWREMDEIYLEARRLTRETGIRHEVDHICPLQGKMISGLHVPWNLQILTQAENVAKSNRYAELYGDVEK